MPGRSRCLRPGPALEEHQERTVPAVRVGDLASEDGQLLPRRVCVVERDGELVLGDHETRDVEGDGILGRKRLRQGDEQPPQHGRDPLDVRQVDRLTATGRRNNRLAELPGLAGVRGTSSLSR